MSNLNQNELNEMSGQQAEKLKACRTEHQCWRCGSDPGSWLNRRSQLLGGYEAILCTECINDWMVLLRQLPEFAEIGRLRDEHQMLMLSAAGLPERLEEIRPLLAQLRVDAEAVESTLFAIAEDWVANAIEREKPEPPEPPTEEELQRMREDRIKGMRIRLAMLERQSEAFIAIKAEQEKND